MSSASVLSISTASLGRSLRSCLSSSRPFLPGMVMSSSATSNSCASTSCSASCALQASPSTRISSAELSIKRTPLRAIAWSSTSKTRMGLVLVWFVEWQAQQQGGALAGPAGYFQFAVKMTAAFMHAEDAPALAVEQALGFDALAVVADAQFQHAVGVVDLQRGVAGAGVPHHIGQRFLGDAEQHRAAPGVELQLGGGGGHRALAMQARTAFHLFGVPL